MVTITPSERFTPYAPVVPTTVFPVNFPIFDPDDVKLYLDGEEITGITVTATFIEGVSTNAVVNVMGAGIVGDVMVVGARVPRRTDQYQTGAPLTMPDHNYSLNRLTIENQEQRRDLSRSLKMPIDSIQVPDLPDPVPNGILGWDATGTELENKSPIGVGVPGVAGGIIFLSDTPEQIKDYLDLDLVNNTSDLNKPISTLTQAAIDLKASTSALTVGLGTKQPLSANLTTLASIIPGAAGQALLASALASDVRNYLDTPVYVDTFGALRAVDTTKDRVVVFTGSGAASEAGRSGTFVWMTGDFTAQRATDPNEGIYVKADAIAVTVGMWVRIRTDIKYSNVLWWGALGDGVQDDSAAVGKAVDYVLAIGRGVVYFPSGTYRIGSVTTRTFAAKEISLKGEGQNATRIMVDKTTLGANGFIDFFSTDHSSSYALEDMSIYAVGQPTGWAVRMRNTYQGDNHRSQLRLNNVLVHPSNIATDYFTAGGLDFSGTWQPILSNFIVAGPFGPGVTGGTTDAATIYKMQEGVRLDDCFGPYVTDFLIYSCSTGLRSWSEIPFGGAGQPATQAEGLTLDGYRIVNTKVGFHYKRTTREPELFVGDGHINFRDVGIYLNGVSSFHIGRCLFYNEDVANSSPAAQVYDIVLQNVERGTVRGPEFYFAGSNKRINVFIDGTTYAQGITLGGMIFGSTAIQGIRVLGANSARIIVEPNYWAPVGGPSAQIVDDLGVVIFQDIEQALTPRGQRIGSFLPDGAVDGPRFDLDRLRNSPAAFDRLGILNFRGKNTGAAVTDFGAIRTTANAVAAGSEIGQLDFLAKSGGVLAQVMNLLSTVPTTGDTGMFLLMNTGSGPVIKRVGVGAPDSAGAGFRHLHVLN